MSKEDPRYVRYQAIKNALKWLCVVAYGRLGFANSTFGRINSHEVVSFIGRKMLLKAKEIAEDHGFTVLHAYVDSLFINKPGVQKESDLQFLLDEIEQETKLPIEVEDVYCWMAFVSSRQNPNLSVANRFFGLKPDGEYKIRGIACRREDTPLLIAKTQLQILQILAQETDPAKLNRLFPDVLKLLYDKAAALYQRTLPLDEFMITQRLSRDLADYKIPSPVARAAMQLQTIGRNVQMGQRIRYVYSMKAQRVHAWDLPETLPVRHIHIDPYKELLIRAAHEILQPLGISKTLLTDWIYSKSSYLAPPGVLIDGQEIPLLASLHSWKQLSM